MKYVVYSETGVKVSHHADSIAKLFSDDVDTRHENSITAEVVDEKIAALQRYCITHNLTIVPIAHYQIS